MKSIPCPPGPVRRLGAIAIVFVVATAAGAGLVSAEEWHEAYRSALAAQARGDHARATEALRRAIRARPEPGRNVVTYGTNLEPRYFPYLRLAESCLALGRLDAAREALETSTVWKREPAEERQALEARLATATEQRRRPLPTPSPEPPPVPMPAPPSAPVVATPVPPPPTAPPADPSPTPLPARKEAPSSPTPRSRPERAVPAPTPEPPAPTAAPTPATGGLEVVSQPGSAAVYVDDEPVGSTDPQTGRLVLGDLPAGPHRVRVSRADHEDAVREIEVPRGARAVFHATLRPVSESPRGFRIELLVAGLLAAALVIALTWRAWRRPDGRPESVWARSTPVAPRSGPPSGGRATPPGQLNPGARQDEHGQEWFGDYRLLGLLGRGGMASVFEAERRNDRCALKRPLGSFLDDRPFIDRFLREAEIGRTLNHPNIVRILERGEVENVPYFTMEILAGQTLQGMLRERGRADPRTAAGIVVQIAEALDFAHSKGVVHRDLKPSNVMLLGDRTAKVMDFGIARALRFDDLTASGAFLGTPDYVAPEMVEGRGTEPRSDLYSLGIVFYEVLTGQRPFGGDVPFAILRKHCTEEPPPMSRFAPGLPADLEAIVLRLLRKRPEDRPASAEELVVTLRDWLHRAA